MKVLRSPGYAQSSYRGSFDVPPCAPGDLSNHSDGARGFFMFTEEQAARFLAKISRQDDECWLWVARIDRHGYGKFYYEGAMRLAHRVAYEGLVGPIPAGLVIDHVCRVRACVNPAHLEPVTAEENGRRGIYGILTTHCPKGHVYDDANTHWYRTRRFCRACNRAAARRYSAQRKLSEAIAMTTQCPQCGADAKPGLPMKDDAGAVVRTRYTCSAITCDHVWNDPPVDGAPHMVNPSDGVKVPHQWRANYRGLTRPAGYDVHLVAPAAPGKPGRKRKGT